MQGNMSNQDRTLTKPKLILEFLPSIKGARWRVIKHISDEQNLSTAPFSFWQTPWRGKKAESTAMARWGKHLCETWDVQGHGNDQSAVGFLLLFLLFPSGKWIGAEKGWERNKIRRNQKKKWEMPRDRVGSWSMSWWKGWSSYNLLSSLYQSPLSP